MYKKGVHEVYFVCIEASIHIYMGVIYVCGRHVQGASGIDARFLKLSPSS